MCSGVPLLCAPYLTPRLRKLERWPWLDLGFTSCATPLSSLSLICNVSEMINVSGFRAAVTVPDCCVTNQGRTRTSKETCWEWA